MATGVNLLGSNVLGQSGKPQASTKGGKRPESKRGLWPLNICIPYSLENDPPVRSLGRPMFAGGGVAGARCERGMAGEFAQATRADPPSEASRQPYLVTPVTPSRTHLESTVRIPSHRYTALGGPYHRRVSHRVGQTPPCPISPAPTTNLPSFRHVYLQCYGVNNTHKFTN